MSAGHGKEDIVPNEAQTGVCRRRHRRSRAHRPGRTLPLSPEGDAAAANDGSTFIKIREENLFAFNRASDEEFTSLCYTVPV